MGFDWDNPEKVNQSKPPLRWFANGCERVAHYFLIRYLYWDDLDVLNRRARLYSRISVFFYGPYKKWGTYYTINTKNDNV